VKRKELKGNSSVILNQCNMRADPEVGKQKFMEKVLWHKLQN